MLITTCLSITTVSAANQTIGPSDASGIDGAISTAGTGDTVFLNPGTYDKQGLDIGITINKNITIQGNGAKDAVIIDAKGNGRIFSIDPGLNLTFINLTFKNANVIGNGSAIYNVYSTTTMTFINCTFINNTGSNGGAIYNSGSNLNIRDFNFTDNIANNDGAIWNIGSNSTINSSKFTNNSADIGGGAIVNTGSNVNISNSSFNKNKRVNYGGAVDNRAVNVTLSESNFTDNTANPGGGICNLGYMNLTKNKMNNNSATLGKVIYNGNTTYVSNLTFINMLQ